MRSGKAKRGQADHRAGCEGAASERGPRERHGPSDRRRMCTGGASWRIKLARPSTPPARWDRWQSREGLAC